MRSVGFLDGSFPSKSVENSTLHCPRFNGKSFYTWFFPNLVRPIKETNPRVPYSPSPFGLNSPSTSKLRVVTETVRHTEVCCWVGERQVVPAFAVDRSGKSLHWRHPGRTPFTTLYRGVVQPYPTSGSTCKGKPGTIDHGNPLKVPPQSTTHSSCRRPSGEVGGVRGS